MIDSLRGAYRSLRRQRAYAAVVVLSLALAIALNTTMYSVLDALIHPRVDMRDPQQLYYIGFYGDLHGRLNATEREQFLRHGLRSMEDLTGSQGSAFKVLLERERISREAAILEVTQNYFDLLGIPAIAGRTFTAADLENHASVLVLDERLARDLFGDPRHSLGQALQVEGKTFMVVGVVGRFSSLPKDNTGAWLLHTTPWRGAQIVRLRSGTSRQQAEKELAQVAAIMAHSIGEPVKDVAFRLKQAIDPEFQLKGFHKAMIFAVFAVLLVACANLANIQLARGIGRRRELALRSAVGATRARLVGHLVSESLLLALAGLALGLVLAYLGGQALRTTIPDAVGEYVVEPRWSWRVLAAALGATLTCVLLIGVAPALHVSRLDPAELIKQGHGTGATRGNRRQYSILVAAEIALALALLSGAFVMVRSALKTNIDSYGFDPAPLVTGLLGVRVDTTRDVRPPTLMTATIFEEVASRLRTIEGVEEVAVNDRRGVERKQITFTDGSGAHAYPAPMFSAIVVSPRYFRAFGLPTIQGSDFPATYADEPLAIVDQVTAHTLWPNSNPVGQQLKLGAPEVMRPYARVVGVVGEPRGFHNDRLMGMGWQGTKSLGSIYYLPSTHDTLPLGRRWGAYLTYLVRTKGIAAKIPSGARQALMGGVTNGQFQPFFARTMDEELGLTNSREQRRFIGWMFSVFAAMGVGLAAFGIYGVVAHSVAERRRELGVRIALGARRNDILHSVLRESVVVALAGAALGLLATKYGVFLLSAMAWEDDLYNAWLFAGVALLMVLTAGITAFIPALRATRIDPTDSLRAE